MKELRVVAKAGFDFPQGKIALSQFFFVDAKQGFVEENARGEIRFAFVEGIEEGVFRFAVLAFKGEGVEFL